MAQKTVTMTIPHPAPQKLPTNTRRQSSCKNDKILLSQFKTSHFFSDIFGKYMWVRKIWVWRHVTSKFGHNDQPAKTSI